jgi:hypothetical protein
MAGVADAMEEDAAERRWGRPPIGFYQRADPRG